MGAGWGSGVAVGSVSGRDGSGLRGVRQAGAAMGMGLPKAATSRPIAA